MSFAAAAPSSRAYLLRLLAVIALALAGLGGCAAPQGAGQRIIHERSSPYGPIIVTEDGTGLRTLLFERDGARQSAVMPGDPAHLELAYARTAMAALALVAEPRRVLVVGLGGGSLPMFLRHYYPQAQIDIAEINADVADVARGYFGFREDARMKVHVGDGRAFIEAVREPAYDLIFLDAFGAWSVPAALTTQEFLGAVRRALRPGGAVVGNVWARTANPLYDDMVRTYEAQFDALIILNAENKVNRIVLGLPRTVPPARAELAGRARRIARELGFRFDLGVLVEAGWVEHERGAAGRVLRDADGASQAEPRNPA